MKEKLLKSKFILNGFNISTISKELGISTNSLRNKLKGAFPFKENEMKKLADVLKLSNDEMSAIFFD